MNRVRLLAPLLLALCALAPVRADGQSITTGEISGVVETLFDAPLGGVRLSLTPVDGGLSVVAQTDGEGRFLLPLLSPGEYELLAERLGYQPVVLGPIPVRSDRRIHVRVTLDEAVGVVESPVEIAFDGAALAVGSRPGRTRYFGPLELRDVPVRDGTVDELLRFSSRGERALEAEGLPLSLGGFVVGGIPYSPVGHGGLTEEALPGLLLPMVTAGGAELVLGRPDVAWPGAAGSLLSTQLRSAPAGFGGAIDGTLYPGGLTFDQDAGVEPHALRGNVLLGGSILGDSANTWVFAEAQQRTEPVRYWPLGAAGVLQGLQEGGLEGAELLNRGAVGEWQRFNVGGRFDWRLAGGQSVDVFALYGQGTQDHARPGPNGLSVPAAVEARDLLVGATATMPITDATAGELRIGFSQSGRDYLSRSLIDTGLGNAAIGFSAMGGHIGDRSLPAALDRSQFLAQGTVHFRSGTHQLKSGLGGRFTQHDRARTWGGEGRYLFSDAQAFVDRVGVFQRIEGTATIASFSTAEYFAYGQDTWRVAPGLDFTTGVRYELETVPVGDVLLNRRWRELTGIDNTAGPDLVRGLGLVVGFEWDVREQHEWRVRGDLAIQQGDVSPDLLGEALTHDGRLRTVAAVGDVTDVLETGSRLTILSPDVTPPTTTRASVGLSRALGTMAVHLDAVIRETTGLPRRTDLNRPVDAAFRDQYDRPVFGELTQVGGLLVPTPAGNRRFGEFDAVTVVSSGASSSYWGITTAAEKRAGLLRVVASYTYSRTRDDWLGAGSAPLDALSPFAGSEELSGWADGVSDFDVPHRWAVVGELTVPFARALRLGGVYNWSSGRPFTPGFGRGIDANADGVAGNDPAFIDDEIEGMSELMVKWDCLRQYSGRFAARNSCRRDARTLLDLWLGVRIPLGEIQPELRIEALALDAEGRYLMDTSLYRLDPAGTVSVDHSTGEVDVPLVVNSRFGRALQPETEPRRVRISLRMDF